LGTGNDIYLPEDFSRFCKKFPPFFTEEGRSVGIGKTVFWNMQGAGHCAWKGACEEFGQEHGRASQMFFEWAARRVKMACTQPIPYCNGFHDFLNGHVDLQNGMRILHNGHVDF
jgi:hypothetical protein